MSTYSHTSIFVAVTEDNFEHWKSFEPSEVTRYDQITGVPYQMKTEKVALHVENQLFPDAEDFLDIKKALEINRTNYFNELSDGYLLFSQKDSPFLLELEDIRLHYGDYSGDYSCKYAIAYSILGTLTDSSEFVELDENEILKRKLMLKQWFKDNFNKDVEPVCYVRTSLG